MTKIVNRSQYIERYEQKRRQRIESKDKQLLKQLTSNTRFCKYCYQPFSCDDEHIRRELTTPYMALLDLMSAIIFVIIPIIWIPLILLFCILAGWDYCVGRANGDGRDDEMKNYSDKEFDKEYFAAQFKRK